MKLKICVSFLLLLLISFCGNKETGPSKTAQDLAEEGWTYFIEAISQNDYINAIEKFREALEIDAIYTDAHNGIGWSFAKLDSLNKSITSFQTCINYEPPDSIYKEAVAGITITYHANGNYQNSIEIGNAIIQGWSFSRKTEVNYSDITLVMAECYYLVGEFDLSLYKVQILAPGFNVNVNTSQGRSALAQKIEQLKPQIFGG